MYLAYRDKKHSFLTSSRKILTVIPWYCHYLSLLGFKQLNFGFLFCLRWSYVGSALYNQLQTLVNSNSQTFNNVGYSLSSYLG